MDEQIYVPFNGTILRGPWPFTCLEQALDKEMKSRGINLTYKSFNDDTEIKFPWSTIELERWYGFESDQFIRDARDTIENPDQEIGLRMTRTLDFPNFGADVTHAAYGNFLHSEVTWFVSEGKGQGGYVPSEIILDRFKDGDAGKVEVDMFFQAFPELKLSIFNNRCQLRSFEEKNIPNVKRLRKHLPYIMKIWGERIYELAMNPDGKNTPPNALSICQIVMNQYVK